MGKKRVAISGKIQGYLRWPFITGSIFIAMNAYIYTLSPRISAVVFGCLVLYYVLSGLMYFFHDNDLFQEMVNFADQYLENQNDLMNEMEIPYVLVRGDSRVLMSNQAFKDLIHVTKLKSKHLEHFLPSVTMDMYPAAGSKEIEHFVELEERYFKVKMKKVTFIRKNESDEIERSVDAIAIYFFDETEIKRYIKQNQEQKLVVGLIYIDNYEETIDSIDESRTPLFTALIERKIDRFAMHIDGLVKKLEKDKFILLFQAKHLVTIQRDKFSVLEDIKSVDIGNEMTPTLSMGFGVGLDTITEGYEFSRSAIDLAVGRGGDQAVIKERERIHYYGGKTTLVDKHTRVKARVKAQALKELIDAKEEVFIMGHAIADMDSLGSAIGVYRIAKTLNKKASIVVNDVTTSVRPLMDMFLNDSYYEKDTFVNSARALEMVRKQSLLVVVDTNRPSYTDCPELLSAAGTVVVLDHHRASTEAIDNAMLSYIEPYASSACEMVAEIQQYITEDVKLRSLEADAMFAGLSMDTNNFMTKTGVRTFEAAAYLRRSGADMVRVRKMFRNDLLSYQTRAEAVRNAEVFGECMAVALCPYEGIVSPTVIAAQAANELLNIAGIKASFVLTMYNEVVYISARSIDEINVQVIMERLGGGGHSTVAGAQMAGKTIEECKKLLTQTVENMIVEGEL